MIVELIGALLNFYEKVSEYDHRQLECLILIRVLDKWAHSVEPEDCPDIVIKLLISVHDVVKDRSYLSKFRSREKQFEIISRLNTCIKHFEMNGDYTTGWYYRGPNDIRFIDRRGDQIKVVIGNEFKLYEIDSKNSIGGDKILFSSDRRSWIKHHGVLKSIDKVSGDERFYIKVPNEFLSQFEIDTSSVYNAVYSSDMCSVPEN
jgi:hypothetical protein